MLAYYRGLLLAFLVETLWWHKPQASVDCQGLWQMYRCMPQGPYGFPLHRSSPQELYFKESKFLPSHLSAKIYFSLVKMKRRKTKSHPSSFELIIFHLKLTSFLQWGQVILFEQSDTSAWMERRILKLHFSEMKKKLDSVFPSNVAVHHLLLTEELPENITIFTHYIPNVVCISHVFKNQPVFWNMYSEHLGER